MSDFADKARTVEAIKTDIRDAAKRLHPTHEAEALREVEAFAGKEAAAAEERNDRDGVPETPRDVAHLDDDGDFVHGRPAL